MPVRFSFPAKADIRGIVAQIKADNPTAAKRWAKELRRKCREILGRHPQVGEAREISGESVRRFSFGNYVIYFTSNPPEIQRVIHGAREDAWNYGG